MNAPPLLLLVAALALPATARSASPAADPDLARGKELLRAGQYDAAVRVLEPVVRRLARSRRSPEAADAHLRLGIAYAGLGRIEPARAEFREALRRDPAITLDPQDAPPAAMEIFSEVWRDGAARGTVSVPTPPPPATSTGRMGKGVKIGIAAAAVAIGAAAAVTAAGADSTGPQLNFVPVAPSPSVQLVAAAPDAGSTVSAGQRVTVTVRSSLPASAPPLTFHLVAEAATSAGQVCLSGRGGPFGLSGDRGSITGSFSLSAVCPAPFTTTTLVLSMEEVGTGARPYASTYQGAYRVVP